MIQAFINEGTTAIGAQGTTPTLAAETLLLIETVYREIQKNSGSSAEVFKICIQRAVEDNVPFVSDEDLTTKFKEELKKSLREADNGED